MENFKKLKQAVDIMGKIVPKYVRKKMEEQYNDKAFSTACENLGKNSAARKSLEQKGWKNGIDLYIALKVISRQQQLFEKELTVSVWSYCLRMLFYRNFTAHPTPEDIQKFNQDTKINTYLEEISVFLAPIHAESAKNVSLLKEKSSDEPSPPKKQYPVLEMTPPLFHLRSGERKELSGLLQLQEQILVHISVNGKGMYRFGCFGLNASNVLADSRYIICENVQHSPEEAIAYLRKCKEVYFFLNLNAVPEFIDTLAFTISMENGEDTAMNDITNYTADIAQNSKKILSFEQAGTDFNIQNAITSVITIQLYRKNGSWRVQAIGNGFSKKFEELKSFFAGISENS